MTRYYYQGILREDAFYIERPADHLLFEALSRGDLCFVLGPRQIGKSSLRHRVAQRLTKHGTAAVHIDLNRIGTEDATAERWYYTLARAIARDLKLDDPLALWSKEAMLTPEQRFELFLRQQVIPQIPGPVAIFIDEIDVLLKLPISRDSFFAMLRALSDARAMDPKLGLLNFCLLGVTTLMALILDPVRTPFNIGTHVALEDFSIEEARGFLPGLAGLHADPGDLLNEVMSWTAGHPYMTQRICYTLAEQGPVPNLTAQARVAELVAELYLRHGREQDPNLANAARCLSVDSYYDASHEQMLRLYRRLLNEHSVPVVGDDRIQRALRLSGIAAERRISGQLRLCPRNRIFTSTFDIDWLNEQDQNRDFVRALQSWLETGKQDAYLLRGEALQRAWQWAEGRADIRPEELEFLSYSSRIDAHEKQIQAEVERLRRQNEQAELLAAEQARLAQRRRQFFIASGVVSVILSACLAAVAIFYAKLLDQNRDVERRMSLVLKQNEYVQHQRDNLEDEIAKMAKVQADKLTADRTRDLNSRTLAAELRMRDAEQRSLRDEKLRDEALRQAQEVKRQITACRESLVNGDIR